MVNVPAPTLQTRGFPSKLDVMRESRRTPRMSRLHRGPKIDDDSLLGQFIPIHYHYQMLTDPNRMGAFKSAIQHAVPIGSRVLELGGGTGVLSYFAAQRASRVYCVERLPANAAAARGFLEKNGVGDVVKVIEGDALEYLPPEPVDVVICEMLHSAMLREKQIPVIASFKQRYLEKFGGILPRFMPEALILGVQAIEQDFDFDGFHAPVPLFSDPTDPRAREISPPAVYSLFAYEDAFSQKFGWSGSLRIAVAGTVNALRFVTKNVLAVLVDEQRTIDWHMSYLVVPLPTPVTVAAGDSIDVRFSYHGGDGLICLLESLEVRRSK